MMSGGRDMTDEFDAYHPGYVSRMLGRFYVGEMETPYRKELPSYQQTHRKLVKELRDAGLYQTSYWFYIRRVCCLGHCSCVLPTLLGSVPRYHMRLQCP